MVKKYVDTTYLTAVKRLSQVHLQAYESLYHNQN